ncbi:MAG: hypothetical protein HPY55_10340 [Firmicutes bacterium]|nr:hypothetical protein [Bacillota bacterium]
MAENATRFRRAIVRYIGSWDAPIGVREEKNVGYRFVGTPRKLDIVLGCRGKYLGIEAKLQEGPGTAYQKLSYTLEDARACPVPVIIVFSGSGIKDDMKAALITSGIGIEVGFKPHESDEAQDSIIDHHSLLRQRVYIELGLDWFDIA